LESGSLTPLERKKLTPKQLEVWDLRFGEDPPVPLRECGRRLGISEENACKRHHDAMATLGRTTTQVGGQNKDTQRPLWERKDPDELARAMVTLANPAEESIAQIARDLDLPIQTATAIAKAMNGRLLPLTRALGEVTKKELSDLAAERAYAIGVSIDDAAIQKMQPYQRAIAFCALTDKHLLLEGQPTQVLSVKEMKGLDELMSLMITEARRRGLRADADPETQRVMLTEGEMADGSPDMGRRKAP
jgi:hypothetical protein